MKVGKVWYVGAGPGNPDLITLRGKELLREADVIVHDSEISSEFFYECPESTQIVEVRQTGFASRDELNLIAQQIVRDAQAGANVVRLKVGDPLFFSRALDEIETICAAGIPLEIVPGIASPLAAAAYAGVPLTETDGFIGVALTTATDLLGKAQHLESLARMAIAAETICVLLVAEQLRPVVERLLQMERFQQSNSVLVYKASLPEQRVLEAPLNKLVGLFESSKMVEPALLVVGKVTHWRQKLSWFESLPLFGKRLLLFRPREQSYESARAIRRGGASPLSLPLIEIEPIANNLALGNCIFHLNEYDWVIFTSANGVEQFRQVIARSSLDARAFGRAKIAVIGPGTAKPLEKWGIRPDLIAEEHVAEGLARQILACGPAKSALLIRALQARDTLPNSLQAAGFSVNIVAAYTTKKLAEQQRERLKLLLQSGNVDAVLVTSSSMADALVGALAADAEAALSKVCVASIGPITTATLARLGIKAHLTAQTYTVQGLLDALESYFKHDVPRNSNPQRTV